MLCGNGYSAVLTEHVSGILIFSHNLKIEINERKIYLHNVLTEEYFLHSNPDHGKNSFQ